MAADAESGFTRVTFLCDQVQDLSGLSVYDAADRLCAPLTDAETGETLYGSYRLKAGEYRYLFHDDAGLYEDLEAAFSVDADTYAHLFDLPLTPAREVYSFSYTYVNPIYADVIREGDIPQVSVNDEAQIDELLAFADGLDDSGSRSSNKYRAESGIRQTTVEAAGQELKEQIKSFEDNATVHLVVDTEPSTADWQSLGKRVFTAAIAHTGVPTDGDYLRYEYGGYNATGKILSEGGKYV